MKTTPFVSGSTPRTSRPTKQKVSKVRALELSRREREAGKDKKHVTARENRSGFWGHSGHGRGLHLSRRPAACRCRRNARQGTARPRLASCGGDSDGDAFRSPGTNAQGRRTISKVHAAGARRGKGTPKVSRSRTGRSPRRTTIRSHPHT